MMTDPIADMLTRIRNAYTVHKKEADVSYSKIKKTIADILVREGYLAKVEEKKEGNPTLVLSLKYIDGQPAVREIKRISKPGARTYVRQEKIGEVLNGYGLSILSTPKGVMTNREAKAQGVGGELLCEVY